MQYYYYGGKCAVCVTCTHIPEVFEGKAPNLSFLWRCYDLVELNGRGHGF